MGMGAGGSKTMYSIATLMAWYKCQNSQNAQKCLRRVLKVLSGLRAESLKRVSRTVQTLFRTGGNSLKQGFAPCKRLFWGSRPGGPKTPFALSLSTFGHFGCFDTCTRPSGSQAQHMILDNQHPLNLNETGESVNPFK